MEPTDRTDANADSRYTAIWLYRATESRFELEPDDAGAIPLETATIFDDHSAAVHLRASYSTIGFRSGTDLMFWVHSAELRALQNLATDLHGSAFSAFFELTSVYAGFAATEPPIDSASVPNIPPRSYVRIAPFSMKPEWFQLDPAEQQRFDTAFAALAANQPAVRASRFAASGLAEHDFVLVQEADDPLALAALVRAAQATAFHAHTIPGAPVIFGSRMPLEDAISSAL